MRLTLSLLLVAIILAVPGGALGDEALKRDTRDQNAGARIGTVFTWPESPYSNDPENALSILSEAAEETGSNVIRTSVGMSGPDRNHITHYVYLVREDSRLFDEFTLDGGRWLTREESRSGSATVTSTRPESLENPEGQENTDIVGAPRVLVNAYDLTFTPLHRTFDSLPAAGRYVIEPPGADADRDAAEDAADRFLDIVHQRLVEAGMTDLTVEDLAAEHRNAAPSATDPSPTGPQHAVSTPFAGLRFLPYALAVAATLLVSAVLIREGKRIGVMRLVGYSTARIWYRAVGRLQIVSVLAGLLVCVGLAVFLPGADPAFALALATSLLSVTAITFAATAVVGLVVINRIHIADLVKGGLQ